MTVFVVPPLFRYGHRGGDGGTTITWVPETNDVLSTVPSNTASTWQLYVPADSCGETYPNRIEEPSSGTVSSGVLGREIVEVV